MFFYYCYTIFVFCQGVINQLLEFFHMALYISFVQYKTTVKESKMKKYILSAVMGVLLPMSAFSAMPYVGLYQTIDDETGSPKSIVALYEYKNGNDVDLAGRIVALYGVDGEITETLEKPIRVAKKVKGKPKTVGLDILWGMEWDDDDHEYEDGEIMDPKSGKVYSSVIWQEKENELKVRGKIGPFGRTQTWNLLDSSSVPSVLQNLNTSGWRPIVIK